MFGDNFIRYNLFVQYIAFLRGINVGGRKVLMDDLQDVFLSHGFSAVKTLIASGNVIFETAETNEEKLRLEIENMLLQKFGFRIAVILRSKEALEKLVKSEPFKDAPQEKGVRLQITLFSENIKSFEPIKKDGFEIHVIGKRELASIVYPEGKTTDLMTFIDKTFGKNSTTRDWNTLLKLID